jgi:signal transduction histidine kinase
MFRVMTMPPRLILLFSLVTGVTVCAEEPITNVAAVRRLSVEQASRGLPVSVEAVVTFYDKGYNFFVTDEHDGIFIFYPKELATLLQPKIGDRVRIEGVTVPGDFLPAIAARNIQLLASGQHIPYRKVNAEELLVPAMECQAVELEAIVKGTSTSNHFNHSLLTFDVQVQGWNFKAVFRRDVAARDAQRDLVEKKVRLRGVAASSFNDQRQLTGRLIWVDDIESITLLDDHIETLAAPILPVDQILRVDSPPRQRIRIRGCVTHVDTGRGIYLRGEGGGMLVLTAQIPPLEVGDHVEAEGYPVMSAFRPNLTAVRVTRLDLPPESPQPVPLVLSAARHSREHDELVTLDAEVAQADTTSSGLVLLCRAEGVNFQAILTSRDLPQEPILPEMKLRLTGICEVMSDHPQAISLNASGFKISVRTSNDITILQRPSWWTRTRMFNALGIVALTSLVVIAWAFTLNRTVNAQTLQIREHASLHATREERERIARDLHDTLEQELMGVTLVLDDTAAKLNGESKQVSEQLDLARRLLRRAREESRSTIRDLRNVSIEMLGLSRSMEEMIRPLTEAAGLAFELRTLGHPYRLKGTQEHQIMLIAREAATNATRHSKCTRVDVALEYLEGLVKLVVSDDGIGFDTEQIGPSGDHFGLRGIKERAEKCRGTLAVVSTPQAGTTLTVTMPASLPGGSTIQI